MVSLSQLGLAFFGLTLETIPKFRASIFEQIHEICFHGQGGYSWETIYNMPIWLRRFTFNKIQDFHKKQNEQIQSQTKKGDKTLIDPTGKVNTPDFAQVSKDYKKPASYK
jgi:hypothetical protein